MLVHRQVLENELDTSPYAQNTQAIAQCESYFVSEGKVSLIRSQKVTGLNKHSGNRWYRWQNTGGSTIYTKKDGKIAGRMFSVGSRNQKRFLAGIAFHVVQNDERMRALVEENVGEVTFDKVFPLAAHYNVVSEHGMPQGMRSAFQQDDLRGLVDVAFGKTRYRRDLARAAAQAHPNALGFARSFRGLVPIDWIVDFLRRHPREVPEVVAQGGRMMVGYGGVKDIRPHIRQLDPRSYRAILRNTTLDNRVLMAIEDMAGVLPVNARVRNITELHDLVFDNFRRRQRVYFQPLDYGNERPGHTFREQTKDIIVEALGEAIDGLVLDDLSIKVARDDETLSGWGNEMRNCIGSYGYQMRYKDHGKVLGGVYKGDNLLANFEIQNGSLRQLLGKGNSVLPEATRTNLEQMFKAYDVVVIKDYWGARENAW